MRGSGASGRPVWPPVGAASPSEASGSPASTWRTENGSYRSCSMGRRDRSLAAQTGTAPSSWGGEFSPFLRLHEEMNRLFDDAFRDFGMTGRRLVGAWPAHRGQGNRRWLSPHGRTPGRRRKGRRAVAGQWRSDPAGREEVRDPRRQTRLLGALLRRVRAPHPSRGSGREQGERHLRQGRAHGGSAAPTRGAGADQAHPDQRANSALRPKPRSAAPHGPCARTATCDDDREPASQPSAWTPHHARRLDAIAEPAAEGSDRSGTGGPPGPFGGRTLAGPVGPLVRAGMRASDRPLTGWPLTTDPFSQIRSMFSDMQSAVDFAERKGWTYEVTSRAQAPVRRPATGSAVGSGMRLLDRAPGPS